jgi:DNA repair exonuclease SbcCD ATPase subunit
MTTLDIIYAIIGFLATGGGGAFASWKISAHRTQQKLDKLEREAQRKQQQEDEIRSREIAKLAELRAEIIRLKAASIPPPKGEDRQAAARAAGYEPGRTSEFVRLNNMGPLRCDGHDEMVRKDNETRAAADRATDASERAARAAEALQSAVAAAAASASVAAAAAAQLEEAVRRENQQTREAIEGLTNMLGNLREWKGSIEARTSAIEREKNNLETRINSLEREMGHVRRVSPVSSGERG